MPTNVTAATFPRYLLGSRAAILSLMNCPRAVWLGLVFVLSAGFAREYDAESLWHEPWYLLIPLLASLVTSFMLYCVLHVVSGTMASEGPFWKHYPAFLTLYWMTAPLAWLYALPVERFLSPLEAAQVNYGLLAIVAVWRVLLITRAASVFFSARYFVVLCVVLLFSDALLLLASLTMPQPALQVMSGVQLNELEQLNADVAASTLVYSVLLLPILVTVVIVVIGTMRGSWSLPDKAETPSSMRASAWALGAASIFASVAVLPFGQPQQYLRYQVERELVHGDLRRGLAMMSDHKPDDFPPHWSPPPNWGKHQFKPALRDVLTMISEEPVAEWVKRTYWTIADEAIRKHPLGNLYWRDDWQVTYLTYFALHPEREHMIREFAPEMNEFILSRSDSQDEEVRELVREFQRLLDSVPGADVPNASEPSNK